MKKLLITLAMVALAAVILSGKIMRRTLNIYQDTVPETETIADETMEFVYDYRHCVDTTAALEDDYVNDLMLLQIGPDGMSKFSSLKNIMIDSIIMRSSPEQVTLAANEGKLDNGEFMTIYKNRPAGKLTNTDKICQDWFRYREDMPSFDWRLTDSVTDVLGYKCFGAKSVYGGREWSVFYTEEIPVMDGPWKLYGLPGLIMKASDADGHYTFECVGIKSKASRPITSYKVPFNDVSRESYYDTKRRYDSNPYAYFEATTGGKITIKDKAGNPQLDAYDPIELPFDYIERDWRK